MQQPTEVEIAAAIEHLRRTNSSEHAETVRALAFQRDMLLVSLESLRRIMSSGIATIDRSKRNEMV